MFLSLPLVWNIFSRFRRRSQHSRFLKTPGGYLVKYPTWPGFVWFLPHRCKHFWQVWHKVCCMLLLIISRGTCQIILSLVIVTWLSDLYQISPIVKTLFFFYNSYAICGMMQWGMVSVWIICSPKNLSLLFSTYIDEFWLNLLLR